MIGGKEDGSNRKTKLVKDEMIMELLELLKKNEMQEDTVLNNLKVHVQAAAEIVS
jgi:hypothetical protein